MRCTSVSTSSAVFCFFLIRGNGVLLAMLPINQAQGENEKEGMNQYKDCTRTEWHIPLEGCTDPVFLVARLFRGIISDGESHQRLFSCRTSSMVTVSQMGCRRDPVCSVAGFLVYLGLHIEQFTHADTL